MLKETLEISIKYDDINFSCYLFDKSIVFCCSGSGSKHYFFFLDGVGGQILLLDVPVTRLHVIQKYRKH